MTGVGIGEPGSPASVAVASTGLAGAALQNGTPTFLSYTLPNDGQMHRIDVYALVAVGAVAETGGAVGVGFTLPNGSVVAAGTQINAGGAGANTNNQTTVSKICAPGTTVTVAQSSALTAGGPATLYATLYAQ